MSIEFCCWWSRTDCWQLTYFAPLISSLNGSCMMWTNSSFFVTKNGYLFWQVCHKPTVFSSTFNNGIENTSTYFNSIFIAVINVSSFLPYTTPTVKHCEVNLWAWCSLEEEEEERHVSLKLLFCLLVTNGGMLSLSGVKLSTGWSSDVK